MLIKTIKRLFSRSGVLSESKDQLKDYNDDINEFSSKEIQIIEHGVKDINKLISAEKDNYKIIRAYEKLLNKKMSLVNDLLNNLEKDKSYLSIKSFGDKLQEISFILNQEEDDDNLMLGLVQFDFQLNDDFTRNAAKLQTIYDALKEKLKETLVKYRTTEEQTKEQINYNLKKAQEHAAVIAAVGKRLTAIYYNIEEIEIKDIKPLFSDSDNRVKYDTVAVSIINHMKSSLIKQKMILKETVNSKVVAIIINQLIELRKTVVEQRILLDKFKTNEVAKRTLLDDMRNSLSEVNLFIKSARSILSGKAA